MSSGNINVNAQSWIRGYWINWKPTQITSSSNNFNPEILVNFNVLLQDATRHYIFADDLNVNNTKIKIPSVAFSGKTQVSLFKSRSFYYNVSVQFSDATISGTTDFAVFQILTSVAVKIYNCSVLGKVNVNIPGRTSFGFLENSQLLDFKNHNFGINGIVKESAVVLSFVNSGSIIADNITGNIRIVSHKATSVFVGTSSKPFVFCNSNQLSV